jgi:hypothetical protein
MSPDYLHLALANLMGRFDRSFAVDRDATLEIWNQPLRSYEVLESYILTASKAMSLFKGPGGEEYVFNLGAVKLVYVRSVIAWIDDVSL